MNIQHSMRNDDWMTPLDIILKVKDVLGDIDLDPASSIEANARIGAKYYFTREMDGLTTNWSNGNSRTVYLNPPGGKRKNKSMAALFWKRLMQYRESGELKHAIFMGFSVELLQSTQNYDCLPILSFPFCVPRKRIAFDFTGPVVKNAPSHSNVIVYIPGIFDLRFDFQREFSELGLCSESAQTVQAYAHPIPNIVR